MLIIGDLQIQEKEPFYNGAISFLVWLQQEVVNRKIKNVIFLGDIFESPSIHWTSYSEIVSIFEELAQFTTIWLLKGNHDESYYKGLILESFKNKKNIKVIDDFHYEKDLEGYSCLFFPFKKFYQEEYSLKNPLVVPTDLTFSHITPKQERFAEEEYTDLTELNTLINFYGHIHTFKEWERGNQKNIILGVPIPSRHGEINNSIIELKSKYDFEYISHPVWYEYEVIKFGQFPENKKNLLKIIEAPDKLSTQIFYKDFFVYSIALRESFQQEFEEEIQEIDFSKNSLCAEFLKFSKKEQFKPEIENLAIFYLSNYLEISEKE